MDDKQRERDPLEVPLETLVSEHQFRDGLRGLRLVRNQWIGVHRCHDVHLSREIFILQMQDMRVWRDVTEAFQHRKRKIWSWQLEREALADQSGQFPLMLERVEARDDATGAVAKQKHWKTGLPRLHESDKCGHVRDVVGELLYKESLTVRLSASPQIQGIDGKTAGHKPIGHPR